MSRATSTSCYKLISSLEDDLRQQVKDDAFNLGIESILPDDVKKTAESRWRIDGNRDESDVDSPGDLYLLPYIDFSDLFKILTSRLASRRNELSFPPERVSAELERLFPIRNRVMHSRPLHDEDLTIAVSAVNTLLANCGSVFQGTARALAGIKEPTGTGEYVQIPNYWRADEIVNNLPVPEHQETGFLGRTKDKRNLLKNIRGAFPVLSLVGPGGVGKTALLLDCLQEVVGEEGERAFDQVVWVTLKTNVLTGSGVKTVRDSICSSNEMFRHIAVHFDGGAQESKSEDAIFGDIREYLETFRVLLAIDNLETIQTDKMHRLCEECPNGSKIIVTSRVGIGDFEKRIQVKALDNGTAVSLLRRYADVLGVDQLVKTNNDRGKHICRQLHDNPLMIKWFVDAVNKGATIDTLLSKKDRPYQEVLNFIFENVFDRLQENEQIVVDTLAASQRPLSEGELKHLVPLFIGKDASIAVDEILESLGRLRQSSVINYESDLQEGDRLVLSKPAKEYLKNTNPPSLEQQEQIQAAMRELRQVAERQRSKSKKRPWGQYNVHDVSTANRRVAARNLQDALEYLHGKEHKLALAEVNRAKELAPEYAEVYRIEAVILEQSGNFAEAAEMFREALEVNPDSHVTRMRYVDFLNKQNDSAEGLKHIKAIEKDCPEDWYVSGKVARQLVYQGEYEGASERYEDLYLASGFKQGNRRDRTITCCQAVDLYKRWLEQDIAERDCDRGRRNLAQGLTWWERAVKESVVDEGMQKELGSLLTVAVVLFGDRKASHVTEAVERLELAEPHLTDKVLILNDKQIASLRKYLRENSSLCERIFKLAREDLQAVNELELVECGHAGTIHSLKNDSYGFIDSQEFDERVFFHRTAAGSAWGNLAVRVEVKFSGKNTPKGPQAIRVLPS